MVRAPRKKTPAKPKAPAETQAAQATVSVGDRVYYRLGEYDVLKIRFNRTHLGNYFDAEFLTDVHISEIYPAEVSRVNEDESLNLRVILDGSDTYHAVRRPEGEKDREWARTGTVTHR